VIVHLKLRRELSKDGGKLSSQDYLQHIE
jgi:hypothetical protein